MINIFKLTLCLFLISQGQNSFSQTETFSVSGNTLFCFNGQLRGSSANFNVLNSSEESVFNFNTYNRKGGSQGYFKIDSLPAGNYTIRYENCFAQKVSVKFELANEDLNDLEICLDTFIDTCQSVFEEFEQTHEDFDLQIHSYLWGNEEKRYPFPTFYLEKKSGKMFYSYIYHKGDEFVFRKKIYYRFPFKFYRRIKKFKLNSKQKSAFIEFEKKCITLKNKYPLNTGYGSKDWIDFFFSVPEITAEGTNIKIVLTLDYEMGGDCNVHPFYYMMVKTFPKMKRDLRKIQKTLK